MLVIFDCDGVLIDSEVIMNAIDAEALTDLGFPTTAHDIARRFAGVQHRTAWERIFEEMGIVQPPNWMEELERECKRRFSTELSQVHSADQTLIELMNQGCETAVASSTHQSDLNANLAQTGLLELVKSHVFSSDQVKRPKPAPDVYLFAASQVGFDPGDCLVIEDSPTGVEAGRRAGMSVLGFVGGGHAYDGLDMALTGSGANGICRSMAEVATTAIQWKTHMV